MSYNLNIWDVSWTNQVQMRQRDIGSERMVAGAIRFLINLRVLQFEYSRILHDLLLVPVLMYGSATMM